MGALKGRTAPSPSGRMHLGNAFSVLLAWLSARSKGMEFLIRMEDLDARCANPELTQQMLADLSWMGIDWDGQPFRQSAHGTQRYDEAFNTLVEKDLVYPCFCSRADMHAASAPHASDGTPIYTRRCAELSKTQIAEKTKELHSRTGHGPAWRLRVTDACITIEDGVCGTYEQKLSSECGDFVIKRSDGIYAYQLVCVIDDAFMGISEVVRGKDLLSSSPRQRYLQDLLRLPHVDYFHHPLILAPDGRRLSKRDGDKELGCIRASGVKPEQLVGKLAFLAGLCDEGECMTAHELVDGFSWTKVPAEDVKLTPCFDFS